LSIVTLDNIGCSLYYHPIFRILLTLDKMLELLKSLLIIVFSLEAFLVPQSAQDNLFAKLDENFPIIEVDLPQNSKLYGNINEESSTSTNIFTNEDEEYETDQEVENSSDIEQSQPNTNKVYAYNTESEKPIGEVASVAVENSESLVSCSENPNLCDENNSPTPTPTLSPTPPIVIPEPDPKPTIYPCPPPPCRYYYSNSEVLGRPNEVYPCPLYPASFTDQIICID